MAAMGRVDRILFMRTDRLGETLLNLPAMACVRAATPHAALTLLVHPSLQPLLRGLPGVDEVLTVDHASPGPWWARAFRLGRRLKAHRFDLAIVSNPKKELHLAVWLAGIPRRVGYDRKWGWCLTHRVPDRKALGERHEVEYNLELVEALGLPTSVVAWRLPRFEVEQREVLQLLDRQGIKASDQFIAIHPWTSNPLKQWPPARYQELIRVVSQHRPVVVIGGPDEQDRLHDVLPIERPRVANLVGRLSLRQLAALLQRAKVLVSNDSGPVHLAAAVGTPTVVLFGTPDAATGPRRWGPWGNEHTVISKPSIDAIAVNDVIEALRTYEYS